MEQILHFKFDVKDEFTTVKEFPHLLFGVKLSGNRDADLSNDPLGFYDSGVVYKPVTAGSGCKHT